MACKVCQHFEARRNNTTLWVPTWRSYERSFACERAFKSPVASRASGRHGGAICWVGTFPCLAGFGESCPRNCGSTALKFAFTLAAIAIQEQHVSTLFLPVPLATAMYDPQLARKENPDGVFPRLFLFGSKQAEGICHPVIRLPLTLHL